MNTTNRCPEIAGFAIITIIHIGMLTTSVRLTGSATNDWPEWMRSFKDY